jgi:SlyX protein
MNDDARLVALEERLTFQQRLIDELNSVVLQQRRELDRLTQEAVQCRAVLERLRDAAALGENLPHEKPPHY